MQGEMLAAVVDGEYAPIVGKLGSGCGVFLQGMVFARDIAEEKACDQLELLAKAAFEARISPQKAALACKVVTSIAQNQCFPGILEETQWGKLVIRAVQALPDLGTLEDKLRGVVLERLGTGLKSVLERVRIEGVRLELAAKLREKWIFLGENTKNRLSSRAIRFLLGEIVTESVKITTEISLIAENAALLGVFLYLRLFDMAKSAQIAEYPACLQASNQLFSPLQLENLFTYLPAQASTPSPTPCDLFRSLYAQIRSEMDQGARIPADKIAAEMRKWAVSEGEKQEIWRVARDMIDASGKGAGSTWKLLLSSMKTGGFGGGKQWNEVNNAVNRKYADKPESGKRWRKVTPAEAKALPQPEEEIKAQSEATSTAVPLQITHKNRETQAKPSAETATSAVPEAYLEPSTVPNEATNGDKIATVYSGPYDSSLNPWDLPDKPLPRAKKSKNTGKSDQKKEDLKPAAEFQ